MRPLAAVLAVLASLGAVFAAAQGSVEMGSTPVAKYWLRMYPLQNYAQYWRINLKVKSLAPALKKAVAAVEKAGGRSSVPLENMAGSQAMGVQQLSYKVPVRNAEKALADLQALGQVESLNKTPALNDSFLQEVRDKLGKLRAERDGNREALSKLPVASEAIDEIVEHLAAVDKVNGEASERILLNIELRETRGSGKPAR